MATIDKLTTAGGTKWKARWRTPNGRSRSKRFDRRTDAERFLAGIEHSKLASTYVDPRDGQMTLREYGERWRKRRSGDARTLANLERLLRLHVYPVFEDRSLASILPGDVEAWMTEVQGRLGVGNVRQAGCYLKAIFRAAIRDRMLAQNPCEDMKLPPSPHKDRIVPVSTSELLALTEAIAEPYPDVVTFAAFSGLRQGEILGLTRDRVNFIKRLIVVDRQWKETGFARVKNWRSRPRREVPLSSRAADAIADRLGPDLEPGGLIFADAEGRPLGRRRLHVAWQRAIRKANVGRKVTFHDLRHYFVSLLISQGFDVEQVADLIGDTPGTVLKYYSHLWPRSHDRVRSALDAAIDAALQDAAPEGEHAGDA
jgi:integrase